MGGDVSTRAAACWHYKSGSVIDLSLIHRIRETCLPVYLRVVHAAWSCGDCGSSRGGASGGANLLLP